MNVVSQSALQGRPVQEQSLVDRAASAAKFWHFLDVEMSAERRPLRLVQEDPQLRSAAHEFFEWFARQCDIRPSLAICVAWADQLDREAQREFVQANPGEPEWKHALAGMAHFAAIAEGGEAQVPLDGVLQVGRPGLKLTIAGRPESMTFASSAVTVAAQDAEGVRLTVGQTLPYDTILALASTRHASLDGALERAGITPR
jgi:hypothetical protein